MSSLEIGGVSSPEKSPNGSKGLHKSSFCSCK